MRVGSWTSPTGRNRATTHMSEAAHSTTATGGILRSKEFTNWDPQFFTSKSQYCGPSNGPSCAGVANRSRQHQSQHCDQRPCSVFGDESFHLWVLHRNHHISL